MGVQLTLVHEGKRYLRPLYKANTLQLGINNLRKFVSVDTYNHTDRVLTKADLQIYNITQIPKKKNLEHKSTQKQINSHSLREKENKPHADVLEYAFIHK